MPVACTRTMHSFGCDATISKPLHSTMAIWVYQGGHPESPLPDQQFQATLNLCASLWRHLLLNTLYLWSICLYYLPKRCPVHRSQSRLPLTCSETSTYQTACVQPLNLIQARCPRPGNRFSTHMLHHCSKSCSRIGSVATAQ